MKIFVSIVFCVSLLSCNNYLDKDNNGKQIKSQSFELIKKESHNELIYYDTIPATAGENIFYPQGFSVNIPKNVYDIERSGNSFLINYGQKQFLIIDSGFKEEANSDKDWKLSDVKNYDVREYLDSYWSKKNYNEKVLDYNSQNRVSKIYTNGHNKIIFFNLKQDNFPSFFEMSKTYKNN